jgi:hypothetical protein
LARTTTPSVIGMSHFHTFSASNQIPSSQE